MPSISFCVFQLGHVNLSIHGSLSLRRGEPSLETRTSPYFYYVYRRAVAGDGRFKRLCFLEDWRALRSRGGHIRHGGSETSQPRSVNALRWMEILVRYSRRVKGAIRVFLRNPGGSVERWVRFNVYDITSRWY